MTRTTSSIAIIILGILLNFQIASAADLIQAVKTGHSFLVNFLIELRADVNFINGHGETALTEAIKLNRADLIYVLLENGASPNLQQSNGDSPILFAIRKKEPVILKMLLEAGADPNNFDALGRTPLMIATQEVDRNEPSQTLVKLLVEFGADVNLRDCFGRDALSYAMIMDEQMINSLVNTKFRIGKVRTESERIRGILAINNYMTMELIRAGADISGWFEWAQLLKACIVGDLQTISNWHSGAFDLDSEDAEGTTAFIIALSNRQVEAAKLLIERGVDISKKSSSHRLSPLAVASTMCLAGVVEILLDRGADKSSSYPLECAMWNQNEDIAILLIEGGISLEPSDDRRGPPLFYAVLRGMSRTVKALLKAGSDVDMVGSYGNSALMLAAQSGHLDIVQMLIQAGADATLENNDGETALDVARKGGHEEVIRILEAAQ